MNEKAQLLVKVLHDRYDLTITEDIAREDISNHVDNVAMLMRIGRQAAKFYVTDDVIRGLADRIGAAVGASNVVDLKSRRNRSDVGCV